MSERSEPHNPGPRPPAPGPRLAGFTLLEMMVATVIMGVAVVGLLSGISSAMRNAANLTEHDRAVMLARAKLDELVLDRALPKLTMIEGRFDPAQAGGVEGGWRARVSPAEVPPGAAPGSLLLERLEVEVFWETGGRKHTFALETYRTAVLAATP